MSKIDKNYHNLLERILQEGYTYEDPNRKGVNRIEIPSYTFRHDFKDGFPAITTKKLNYKSVVTELIWFLRGDTNIKYLVDNGCNIWNKDAYNYYLKRYNSKKGEGLFTFEEFVNYIKNRDKNHPVIGDLGPVYGAQWRKWNTKQSVVVGHNGSYNEFGTIIKDQISNLIKGFKEKPLATDHIVNAWNVGDLKDMALPPCHYGFQIVVRPLTIDERGTELINIYGIEDYETQIGFGKLQFMDDQLEYLDNKNVPEYGFELHWQQRSCDLFLGIPFNIASYATLALILEKITSYKALAIQGDLKKVHLYDNSLDAVKEQLSRDVNQYDKCELKMDTLTEVQFQSGIKYINEIEPGSFKLVNYESYPHIKVEMLSRNKC